MGSRPRAQTTIDFAIAMGIFFVALTAVVAFMPTMTQPYTGGQENPLLSDRLASQLVDGQIGDPSTPSKLDPACTWSFFTGNSGDCDSFDENTDVQQKLGVDSAVQVNVTLRDTSDDTSMELVCWDYTGGVPGDVHVQPCTGFAQPMVEGPNPPSESGSVTIARRYAVLSGDPVYVVVKVWT